ncbi:Solute carrier family 25 member 36-A, partial [Gryllus bimaculatus]
MSHQRDTVIHLVAGGVAGTMGAIVTCPLEVVKTRLQSSTHEFRAAAPVSGAAAGGLAAAPRRHESSTLPSMIRTHCGAPAHGPARVAPRALAADSMGLLQCL